MSTTLTESPLAANLAALGERNAEVAAAVRAAAPRTNLDFAPSRQGAITATLDGIALASRHDPEDEGRRLADTVDVIDHAVAIVTGFGLGYHVKALAERIKCTGFIVVFEPDVALLRAVLERVDHSAWLRTTQLVMITDAHDRGLLGRKLDGAESIVAMGMTFLAHPASRGRLQPTAGAFQQMLTDFVGAARTTFLTTIIRAVDTVRNLLYNVDHYAGGPGVAELKDAARGRLGIVVSAGPSLAKNLDRLEDPSLRERCVIISTQTTLKPLLRRGIRPHYITALDFHEISRRFYDGLTAEDVAGVTLIADPKAHPVILDSFPGPVRCCHSNFLDALLGAHQRDMGTLPPGATVAHLCLYLAAHLGCNPIAFIGQDLCFPDGLYYAPGLAIHDVWAPELNPFNTIASMEWQRIARHRANLHRVTDVHGRQVYSDTQMLTYLQQFERDFAAYAESGIDVIDATEGGVPKQHTRRMSLDAVLDQFAAAPHPPLPDTDTGLDAGRMSTVARRVASVRRDIVALERISRRTCTSIRTMLSGTLSDAEMAQHFRSLDRGREEVDERFEAFELLNYVNQLGVFRRLKADRRLELMGDMDAAERQRAQLERDLQNVEWIEDAAAEMQVQLADATRILSGDEVPLRRPTAHAQDPDQTDDSSTNVRTSVAALVPVDLERNGLGQQRSLATRWEGRSVLQATLERLSSADGLDEIILLAADDADIDALLDPSAISCPVTIERCGAAVWGPEQSAIGAARRWADTCWRGGIGGASAYDECLAPVAMHAVMQRRGLAAALVVAPDWPLIDVTSTHGCGALIERYREHPDRHRLVFNQAPPGLGGCIISAGLMEELAARSRLGTIGALLVYQPHAPQGDPIATEANIVARPPVRDAIVRATFDSPRQRALIERALDGRPADEVDATTLVRSLQTATIDERLPRHIVIEITTTHHRHGPLARERGDVARGPIDPAQLERWLAPRRETGDIVVTFAGAGDPLAHPAFDACILAAHRAGAAAVHVRTDLLVDQPIVDRLLAGPIDVLSVDLHADQPETYARLLGRNAYHDVLTNVQYVIDHRRHLAGPPAAAGFALPLIVPRLARRPETVEEVDGFYDRWQLLLGTAVIDACPDGAADAHDLTRTTTPHAALRHERAGTMLIRADGTVPVVHDDPDAEIVASMHDADLETCWQLATERRAVLPSTASHDDGR